ncbi:MAG TPA: NrsF family protein [Dongiaceae bacterium]|jgi:hypothetical protein|nr:NrsF family protein [Dongiaceae bacterium]
MSDTDALIAQLAERLEPVRRLRKPWLRAALWSAFATALIALLVALRGFRADIGECMRDPAFLVPLAGAWLTGATAALAAFEVSLPDRSRLWLLLPLPAVALWVVGFAAGCLADWIAIPEGAPVAEESVRCLTTILLATAGLLVVLVPMLRKVRTLRPAATAWIGILAVAGFADTAHLLIHPVEASLLVLVINLVPAAAIVLLGGLAGRRMMAV